MEFLYGFVVAFICTTIGYCIGYKTGKRSLRGGMYQ